MSGKGQQALAKTERQPVVIGVSDLGKVSAALIAWLSLRGPSLRIALIADAAVGEGREPDVATIATPFANAGHGVVPLDLDVDPSDLAAAIAQADVILVTGGNTFWLMDRLRKAGLVEPIRQRLAAGGIFVGESAGIVAACRDIGYAAPIDDPSVVEGSETAGLSLLPWRVLPHADHPVMGAEVRKMTITPEVGDIVMCERDIFFARGQELRIFAV